MEFECGKCGSARVVTNVRVTDCKDNALPFPGDLVGTVNAHPDALIFKGARRSDFRAAVCADCGYAEFYATDPAALYEAQQQALLESPPE